MFLANESRSWIENEISYLDKIIIDALFGARYKAQIYGDW